MYHELGHASHYTEVGTGYWALLGTAMASASIQDPSPYGDGTTSGAGRIAITEAWGRYIGYKFANFTYGAYVSELETGKRIDFPWIPYGVFHDLMDTYNSSETWDQLDGYTLEQFFDIMSNSSVTSPVQFKNIFKSTYVPSSDHSKVDDIFTEYDY